MQTVIKAYEPNGAEVGVKATLGGALYNAPPQVIWTAKGYGRQAMATAAVAALVVRPTTVAMVTLFNNSTKNFVIERAFGHNLVGVANNSYGIWLCVHPVGMATPTNDITVRNKTNGGNADTEGIFDIEATVIDNGWFPWGKSGQTVTITTPGQQIEAEISGRIILPPTAAISLQVVATATGTTMTCGFHWFAVPATELSLSQLNRN